MSRCPHVVARPDVSPASCSQCQRPHLSRSPNASEISRAEHAARYAALVRDEIAPQPARRQRAKPAAPPKAAPPEGCFDTAEAARRAGCGRKALRYARGRGELRATRIGRQLWWPERDVLAWAARRRAS